ncbi:glycosyltransferase family 39 protein [Candidatus Woesearchaeota archaeon]|nr:glycosyltransferase family 39 protein [Candidatus Woesearchaeota archaeon]
MAIFDKSLFKLFLIFWIIFITFARIDGWVENSRLDLTRAIVDEGTFKIDSYANNTGDRAYYNGHYYTDKFPGASFLAVPPYFVFKHIFGTPNINDDFYETNPDPLYNGMVFFIIIFTSALFSALTVVLVYKITIFFTKKKTHRYIAAVTYGLGTIAFNYATLFYDHAISTFFSFLAFYIIYSSLKKSDLSIWRFVLAGLSIGFAVITSPFTLVVLFGLFFYLLFKKAYRQTLYFIVASSLVISLLFIYNFSIFKSFDFTYNYIDKEIFGTKPLLIEESGCIKELMDKNFIHKLFLRFYYNKYTRTDCETNFSVLYSNNEDDFFPIMETNSVGESFLLTNVEEDSYYFTKHYLTNNELKPYFFKYVKTNSNISIFFRKHISDVWIKIFYLSIKDSGYTIIDYERGLVRESDCPFDKRLIEQDVSCNRMVVSLDGIITKKHRKEYILLNETKTINTTLREFKFSWNKQYEKNNLFINLIKLMFYPYRGLLFYSPVLLFSFLGLFFMFKKNKLETVFIFLIFLSLLFFQSSLFLWWGGTAFGPRHLLPVIPFLMIPFVFALKKINIKIVLLITFFSILINLCGMQQLEQVSVPIGNGQVFIEGELWNAVYSWKSIGNPLFNYYLPLFFINGPESTLLKNILWFRLPPFLNVVFLLLISFFILFTRKNRSYFFRY